MGDVVDMVLGILFSSGCILGSIVMLAAFVVGLVRLITAVLDGFGE